MLHNHKIRLAINAQQPVVLLGLESFFKSTNKVAEIFSAKSTMILQRALHEKKYDALVIDIDASEPGCYEASRFIKKVKAEQPKLPVYILTEVRERHVLQHLVRLPVAGVLSKYDDLRTTTDIVLSLKGTRQCYCSPAVECILDSFEDVYNAGMSALTAREFEVIQLYVKGNSLRDIAQRMHRSVATIGVHKHNAMNKLNISNNIELCSYVRSYNE